MHLNGSSDSYTYESEAHRSVSCIDHVIGPRYLLPCILSCSVFFGDDSINTSNHRPVQVVLLVQLGFLGSRNEVAPTCPTQHLAWYILSGEHIYLCFTLPVQEFLSRTSLLSPSAFQSHPALIDNTLATVTLFLCSTASKSVPARSHSSGTVKIINLQRLPLELCFAPITMVNVTICMLL